MSPCLLYELSYSRGCRLLDSWRPAARLRDALLDDTLFMRALGCVGERGRAGGLPRRRARLHAVPERAVTAGDRANGRIPEPRPRLIDGIGVSWRVRRRNSPFWILAGSGVEPGD